MATDEITGVAAIKTFFGMSAKELMAEIRELKEADPAGYQEVAELSAAALGKSLLPPKQ